MLLADMDVKTLAITPPLLLLLILSSFFFHLRGAAFGSSKAFHCLLLLSCLLLSSVNTLHNLADYDSLGSNIAERFQSFNGGGGSVAALQNVCPSSNLFFSLLPALGSEYQFDPVVTFFSPSSCSGKSSSSSSSTSALKSDNNLSGVVWLSLKPVHIIEFQPFTGFSRIGGGGTTPLSKELFAKQNTRELSISVSGKQCGGGNGLIEQQQCGGLSSGQGDSIKFLFFYQTGLSCASGVAVFAVPMKSTAPVLMLSLCKKPVSWWLRAKKLSIALLIAVALLILIFCFSDHFIEERNNIAVSKAEKPSTTITISLEMDTLLRSISKETLQVSNEVVSENSVKPMAPSSCGVETSELTVKTVKEKKRRRNKKKKKGAVSELTATDVSSSQSGNSTPRSPMSPKPPAAVVVTQAATKPATTPKPVLSHSATFPVSVAKSVMIIQESSLAPNARAPGAKSRNEVKEVKEEYRYYDIWGDHLTGLHLMDSFKEVGEGRRSSSCFGEDDEFVSLFVKGPHHNLLPSSLSNKPLIKK
ncbi:Transmembrane protein [Hirschfeldia incana]|nr:Transmembrane protein [Hirschfeldia incana]